MRVKYCINCEEPLSELNHNESDFCSDKCAAEFISGADSAILERETNSNPNALVGVGTTEARGILPPNSLDAITALLQTSSSSDIARAVKHLTPNSQNETEPE